MNRPANHVNRAATSCARTITPPHPFLCLSPSAISAVALRQQNPNHVSRAAESHVRRKSPAPIVVLCLSRPRAERPSRVSRTPNHVNRAADPAVWTKTPSHRSPCPPRPQAEHPPRVSGTSTRTTIHRRPCHSKAATPSLSLPTPPATCVAVPRQRNLNKDNHPPQPVSQQSRRPIPLLA